MSEQESRRGNNATTPANFDAPFENQIVRFGVGGLNLRTSLDALEHAWTRLTNLWHENDGEATVRPGQTVSATHAGSGGTCHSIKRLRDPGNFGANDTRFWGVGTTLQRGASGTTTTAASGFSGDPLALVPDHPRLSPDPWMFVGDRAKMLKVRNDGLALPIGLPVPPTPTAALDSEFSRVIAMCEGGDGTPSSLWVPCPGKDDNGHATGVPHAALSTEGPIAGDAIYLVTDPGSGVDSGYDSWWGISIGNVLTPARDLTTLSEVTTGTPRPDRPASDQDIVHIWLKTSHPALMAEIRLYVVVSEVFDPYILPGNYPVDPVTDEPYANGDAYVKAFRPGDYVQFVAANTSQVEAAEQARIYALRDKDSTTRAYNDTRDSWEDARAQIDPGRAKSLQLGLGGQQWFGYGQVGSSFRRGDFQRIGSTPGRDWSTVTGLIVYVRTLPTGTGPIAIGVDDWYITGGSDPDTVEPGVQMYDYRITNYDPRTGAESNGSETFAGTRVDGPTPADAPIDSVRRGIIIQPEAYGDAAVRQRIYRRGGSLIDDWYFVGENDGDGEPFTDELSDAALASAPLLPTDHYQPVPTIRDDGEGGTTVLNQPLSALWGPLDGMLFGCGDPHRPGVLYYSIPDEPDHWSAGGQVEVCAPSEELMNGGVIGHQGFVFSRTRLYLIYPNLTSLSGGVTATPSLCTRGLLGKWAFCLGPGGGVFFVADDGVFSTQGGPETWISEAIAPLFWGDTSNGYAPIDKTATAVLRLTCWETELYFQYQDTNAQIQVMVYHLIQQVWRHYDFGQPTACLQGEDEPVLQMGGLGTGRSYTHTGTTDDGAAITAIARTASASGGRREEKLFGDIFLDADAAGVPLTLQVFLNEETHANTAIPLASGGTGRERFLVHAFGDGPQKAHSIAAEVRFTTSSGQPILYQIGVAISPQPDLTNTRVTTWDDLGSPDETWLTGVTLDCDTGGQTKTITVERDFAGSKIVVAIFDVTSSGRHKFKFSWLAVPANLVRIRPDPAGCVPWLLYRADWIYVQEPPRISKWDIHFENAWDQYYTGLDLYCDTFGAEKRIEIWVDEQRLTNDLAGGLTYWPIQTVGRQVVHCTLPWGRGHVFRFFAIDENPGLLYRHRWHLQEEPSEQANWNQNFSILGTHADKYLKAVIFECDTYGADKTVNVEVDGAVVETLTVNTDGRRVVQIALPQQHLGRVWRMFPIDANPGRLYTAEPIFDEEPFCLDRWETQETNHNLPGWFYPLYAHITLRSTADVTLTTVVQHNQVGGQTTRTYTIPSTGGVKQRRFLAGFVAGKGVLIKYVLTSSQPFFLYRDETSVIIQPWGSYSSIEVKPFGNDDLDPSRTMTHAVLAAQSSGGAATPGGGA